MLSVKDFQVAGAGDCRMRRLLPTQAGDKPPRYISPLDYEMPIDGSGRVGDVARLYRYYFRTND